MKASKLLDEIARTAKVQRMMFLNLSSTSDISGTDAEILRVRIALDHLVRAERALKRAERVAKTHPVWLAK